MGSFAKVAERNLCPGLAGLLVGTSLDRGSLGAAELDFELSFPLVSTCLE